MILVDTLPADAILDPVEPTGPRWLLGLDLGQTTDYTALSIAERVVVPTGRYRDSGEKRMVQMQRQMPRPAPVFHREERRDLHVRFLKRFEVCADVRFNWLSDGLLGWCDWLFFGWRKWLPCVCQHLGP